MFISYFNTFVFNFYDIVKSHLCYSITVLGYPEPNFNIANQVLSFMLLNVFCFDLNKFLVCVSPLLKYLSIYLKGSERDTEKCRELPSAGCRNGHSVQKSQGSTRSNRSEEPGSPAGSGSPGMWAITHCFPAH